MCSVWEERQQSMQAHATHHASSSTYHSCKHRIHHEGDVASGHGLCAGDTSLISGFLFWLMPCTGDPPPIATRWCAGTVWCARTLPSPDLRLADEQRQKIANCWTIKMLDCFLMSTDC
mmetsp:Transcript_11734/g.21450  ORF Transcript_11734/g.21450 Transcript_11734/m.21450 type:complete len:118 (-) Transcript_11734:3-356(-)